MTAVEAILRQPRRVIYQLRQPGAGRLIAAMIFVSVVCSLVYGVVAGTFSNGTQLWAAPLKIAGGLLFSVLICLPSLYIFTCLSGSQARLFRNLRFGMRLIAVDDYSACGFCASSLVVFAINQLVGLDGHVAPYFLVCLDVFRPSIFGKRLFLFARAINSGSEHLDRYFHIGGFANDHCLEANHRQGQLFLSAH
jgi:hypothetical protein